MNLIRSDTLEKVKKLKAGDMIIVKWSNNWVKHTRKSLKKKKAYNIEEIRDYNKEIICNRKNNYYFNYEMFLNGESSAEDVFLIED